MGVQRYDFLINFQIFLTKNYNYFWTIFEPKTHSADNQRNSILHKNQVFWTALLSIWNEKIPGQGWDDKRDPRARLEMTSKGSPAEDHCKKREPQVA